MAIDFKLPNLGENIDAGDVINVLVKEGDTISANQGIVEVETGKATVEIPCPHAGKVTKVHVKAGQSVPVGAVLVSVEAGAGAPAAEKKPAAPAPAAAAPAKASSAPAKSSAPAPVPASMPAPAPVSAAPAPAPAVVVAAESTEVPAAAGPSVRRLARELGIDINRVGGSGPDGRITREDVVAAVRLQGTSHAAGMNLSRSTHLPEGVDARDNYGAVRKQPLTRMRKTIAANMVKSTQTIPQLTNFDDADISELEHIRKASLDDYAKSGVKLTMMPFVMKAVAQALRIHPIMNASIDMERDELVYKEYINLGVAVDTERGLVVPVLRDVDRMPIPAIAQALQDIAERVRANKFTLEDQSGGTFTISNLGAIGGTYSTPIINPPQVGILLLGRSRKLPIVLDNDKIEPRLMMPLSITYDHRVIDGAAAARFLNEVKSYLQVPGRLLLAQ